MFSPGYILSSIGRMARNGRSLWAPRTIFHCSNTSMPLSPPSTSRRRACLYLQSCMGRVIPAVMRRISPGRQRFIQSPLSVFGTRAQMMRRFELVIHECPGAVGVVADARGDFPLVEQDLAHPGKTCRVIVAPGKFRFEQVSL